VDAVAGGAGEAARLVATAVPEELLAARVAGQADLGLRRRGEAVDARPEGLVVRGRPLGGPPALAGVAARSCQPGGGGPCRAGSWRGAPWPRCDRTRRPRSPRTSRPLRRAAAPRLAAGRRRGAPGRARRRPPGKGW